MLKRSLSNKKGLTLIEIIVAVTLILIVMSSFVFVYQSGINLRVNSQRRLQALTVAQTTLEDIKNMHNNASNPWKNMNDLKDWLVNSRGYNNGSSNVYTNGDITITLMALELDTGSPYEELIDIDVSVAYPDKMNNGGYKSVDLRTRLRSYD